MPDVEKTIQGLECCTQADNKGYPKCERCPYADEKLGTCDAVQGLMNDALSLLKAQEPRAMTLEEVEKCPLHKEILPEKDKSESFGVMTGDALRQQFSLMKKIEQNPRIMAWDEVEKVTEGEIIWIEQWTRSKVFLMPMVSTGDGRLGNFYLGLNIKTLDPKYYRPWNGKPTDAQREAMPWKS